ncbi:MAG: hypothetical protein Q4D04_06800 [Clostridia bacterium]|nr:hypothetical protein [Clostridia bacterium]
MKRTLSLILITVMMLTGSVVFAEEATQRNYAPESGSGWLVAEIYGEPVELAYTGSTKSMTGTSHAFESEDYSISIAFDRKIEVGVTMGENSVNQIELISSYTPTEGYYFTKKSSSVSVDSEVLLEKMGEDGIWQGTFRVTVNPGDRWVGDMRPGIIAGLDIENAEFCFCE